MGWASGSEIADGVWDLVREHVPADKRKDVAKRVIRLFEDYDCDTMEGCEQLQKDARAKKSVPK